jgi:hypothetical protein
MVSGSKNGRAIYHDGSIWRYVDTDVPILKAELEKANLI